jgi:chondroitin AC lyase
LGAGLKHDRNLPIITTLDQCHLKSKVIASEPSYGAIELNDDVSGKLPDTSWLWHDDVLYVNQGSSDLHLGPRTQQGSWAKVNITYKNTPVEKAQVFRAWLSHHDDQFAYTVYPNLPAKNVAVLLDNTDVAVSSHTESVQAVYHKKKKIGMAICYQSATVKFGDDWNVSVDQPAALMLRVHEDQTAKITLASMTQDTTPIQLTVNGKTQTISLPTGLVAGQAVTVDWQ